ncbi:hypothetical protein JYT32_00115 [Dehalococcoides mccartyi]|nr:hypothetical protein [Dehalococcoides mccartyi]
MRFKVTATNVVVDIGLYATTTNISFADHNTTLNRITTNARRKTVLKSAVFSQGIPVLCG